MEIGNTIRKLRYKISLTQEQLADRLGVSAQAVSKWENAVAMPDISLLPALAEVFGVSIDDLFDLTADQKLRRIESRMETEDELEPDVFREYEEFLKEQMANRKKKQRACSLLANLYHHRMEADAARTRRYAREAIRMAPAEKDCQWLLCRAEGAALWDWNFANHHETIDFYKEIIEKNDGQWKAPPYYYLIDNLLADHRTKEAAEYLKRLAALPDCRPFLIPVYQAAIALAEYDEKRADAVMEKLLRDFPEDPGVLFEAAQYRARKCDYDQALSLYEASYAKDDRKPRFTDALEAISMIHEIRGEYKQAADAQQRILDSLKNDWGFTEETVVRETERKIERLMKKA